MTQLRTALLPFARFYQRLTDGRHGYPKTGPLYSLDRCCPTEANIEIEDLKLAHDLALRDPDWPTSVTTAHRFAEEWLEGHTRRDGVTPSIRHAEEVMARAGDNPDDLAVAAVHDLLEDTAVTLDDFRRAELSEEVIDGAVTLTRRSGETYIAFIQRIIDRRDGRWVRVKIADNLANLADAPTDAQIKRYAQSLLALTAQ